MKARVAGGHVASATHSLSDLPSAAGRDGDQSPNTVAVGCRSFEPDRHEVSHLASLVVEVAQGTVLSDDHDIATTVVVEVAGSQAAADARYVPWGAGLG